MRLQVSDSARLYPSVLYGPACSGLDVVNECLLLPELARGDWLAFENVGAYMRVLASEFNGLPLPQSRYVVDQQDELLMGQVNSD